MLYFVCEWYQTSAAVAEYKKCVETGIHGCKIVYELQKKALIEKYFGNGESK